MYPAHHGLAPDVLLGDDDQNWNCNVGKVGQDMLEEDKGSNADVVEQELGGNHVDRVEEGGDDGHQFCQSTSAFLREKKVGFLNNILDHSPCDLDSSQV